MTLEIDTAKKIILMAALHQYIVGAELLKAKAEAQGFQIRALEGIDTAKELLAQVEKLR